MMSKSQQEMHVEWDADCCDVDKQGVQELWSKKGLGGRTEEEAVAMMQAQMQLVIYQLTLDVFARYLDRAPGRRVLEIGCGWGRLFMGMKKRYPDIDYTGIDLTPNLVELSKKNAAQHEIAQPYQQLVGDAEHLDFTDASFDMAYSARVFQYVFDVSRAMSEAYRVLRPDGWFAILLPNAMNPVRKRRYRKAKLPHPREMQKWFERAGFVDVETQFLGFMPVLRRLPVRALDRWVESIGRMPGVRRFGVHVVVAGRKPSG